MIEKYLVKRTCYRCSQTLGIGWKYCGFCGELVNNDGAKIQISVPLENLFYQGETIKQKVSNRFSNVSQIMDRMKDTVSVHLNKGEEIRNTHLVPLIFKVTIDGVETLKIDSFVLEADKGFVAKDYLGYYYQNMRFQVQVNSSMLSVGEKHYFINGDCLRIDDTCYIFSLMNQENVKWKSAELSIDLLQEIKAEFLEMNQDGLIFIKPSETEQLTVNKIHISARSRLRDGDLINYNHRLFIMLGGVLFFQDELQESEKSSLAENIHGLEHGEGLKVNIRERSAGSKKLLSDIQFSINPGEMILILGGSGAGKTTLINAIMGNEKADATILLGKNNLYEDFDMVKRTIANVPQFSLHREKDTVYMTLRNAAEMKLVRDFVRDENLLEQKIDTVLKTVNLSRKRDSLVSELSGGEKKRLSIATEYISDPVVFILDEPDSGVDGSNARVIMSSLRSIADNQKIVIVISHNPDRTPKLFDKVLVLAKSESEHCGKLAFYGSVEEALTFFKTDQLELVVSKIEDEPDYYIQKYKKYLDQRGG
ncbi:TPA: ATP-binding cassette domain-containing protein [Streptococcus suis]|uniref:ATP-binding cassette domain-containing protein n=1 Tax=Streptococcus suis TaxID=1307 RepID=UPI000CF65213|nr:ABC transporter ATP-binding protein [Streptococcus suis]